MVILLFTF